ncbi:MAG TPA: efflux RND transporter periplasmic adaptor subunit [Pararhizobium sp.]|uniref:efflux RND transporter periplasmic adaptor subunit n=1 Tax=Pararhizobium sp. TaxID=1977563 RepID=UPI002BB32A61|nr:efflux RND transporter periplasmic adaptor subunit [Pararhizobium sp.]HTO33123.1 efflux RND transporter periplasmic adaptor subunit [Pararhizobium sp.]
MKGGKMAKLLAVAVLSAGAATAYMVLTSRPIAVPVASTERNVAIRVYGLGTVEARIVSKIGFQVGAAVTQLSADDGDAVTRGDLLAHLDKDVQVSRVARARAAAEGAAANLDKAEANVAKAVTVLAQRRAADERQQTLVGRNVSSHQMAEEAKRDGEVAAADLTIARTEVDVVRSQVADAAAALAYEQAILSQHELRAPFDGVVVERHAEAGTVVRAGDVIYTLMDPGSVWVLAYIDEERAGFLAVGQKADIRLRSMPHDVYHGRVARIGIESDRVNEERRVWIACEICPPRAFLGEQAEVMITVAELAEALLVPEDAISGFDGHRGRVNVVRDGRLAEIELTFGHKDQDARIEVVSGLPEDAKIVTTPLKKQLEGRIARVIEEPVP